MELDILTSMPIWATIWAVRKDGNPKKVIIGLTLSRRASHRRSCGLRNESFTWRGSEHVDPISFSRNSNAYPQLMLLSENDDVANIVKRVTKHI